MSRIYLYASVFGALSSIVPAAAFAQAGKVSEIAEVVVTAQRFEESAQRTPLIITALSGDDLVGVTDVRQLQEVTPGFAVAAGNAVQTFVRGVGSLNAQSVQEGAVAYNVDGIFLFASTMISPLMYDLDRVEILKGPQGTLYGRNATGGAVNLITRGASLGEVEGYAEGEVGNFNLRRATGAVNIPLSDTLAVRVAGQHAEHDGYLSDDTDDQNVSSGRIRVLWQPTSDVTVKLGADVSDVDAVGAGSSLNPNPTGDKWLGGVDPRAQTGPFFLGGASLLSSPPNPPPFYKDKQWSAFTQIDADLGFATLTLLPAYRYEKSNYRTYTPGYEYHEQVRADQRSFEARLAHQDDRLRWVVGAYYFKIDQKADFRVRNETNFQDGLVHQPNAVESYAVFGEGTFGLTDTLRLIGGLRYTHEESRQANGLLNFVLGPPLLNPITGLPNVQTIAYNPFDPFTNPTGEMLDSPINEAAEKGAVTWKVGVEMDLSPNSLMFATLSTGFKGGGSYIDNSAADSSFGPEYLTAFELGSRNRFLANTLQVNAELFYWKYKDQQVTYVGFNSQNVPSLLTVNAGKATMYGVDVDIIWKATPNDTFHVGGEYLKSEYDEFTQTAPAYQILPSTVCALSGYDPTPGSAAPTTIDCSGLPLLRAPKWSGLASYEHRFEVGANSDLVVQADVTYASGRYLDATYTPGLHQPGKALFNASITYNAPDAGVTVTGWVRNIADTRVMSGGAHLVPAYSRPLLLPPRTYGVSLRKSF